jgi:hypothetical protein
MNTTDYARAIDRAIAKAEKEYVDQGKLIEAGWAGLRATWLPNATPDQLKVVRYAFMAGAQHLFWAMMGILDADEEPTEDDMRRMSLIAQELATFRDEVRRETMGSA